MTLHKIDREKLAEFICELQGFRPHLHGAGGNIRKAELGQICGRNFETMISAAENWLAITDPGFEVPWEMSVVGRDTAIDNGGPYMEDFDTDGAEATFKAMIAKAGE